MAPPRKPAEPGQTHPIHLRLPSDVFARVEADAKAEARPFNRIIVNDLAVVPSLKAQARLAELVSAMETTLAKYGRRITVADLGDDLLRAVDAALATKSAGELPAKLDALRVARAAMLEIDRRAAALERERRAAQIEAIDRQIEATEALPDSTLDKDNLPALKAERARRRASKS